LHHERYIRDAGQDPGVRELQPLVWRLRLYPLVIATLIALLLLGAALPVPESVLVEVHRQYASMVRELERLLSNSTTREQAVYAVFAGSVGGVLASAAPFVGPLFTAHAMSRAGLQVKAEAFARSESALAVALRALRDPSLWTILAAYAIATTESAQLTIAILLRKRAELELTLALLVLAVALALISATLVALLGVA